LEFFNGHVVVLLLLMVFAVMASSVGCATQDEPDLGNSAAALAEPTDPPVDWPTDYPWMCAGDLDGLKLNDLTVHRDGCEIQGWHCEDARTNKQGNLVCIFECQTKRCCMRICDPYNGSCTTICDSTNGQCRTTSAVTNIVFY
jgi:hypothetical protein